LIKKTEASDYVKDHKGEKQEKKNPLTNTKLVRKRNKHRLKSMIADRKEEKTKLLEEFR
jgi:hypothetical protein